MPITNNSLQGFLQVYAQQSLTQFITDTPMFSNLTTNFDIDIASGGTAVTTRIPTNVYGALNDIAANGWASSAASSSAVTITLAHKGYDQIFSELEFATITPSIIQNTYLPSQVKQMANSITVDALSLVSSSFYTTVMNVNSSSLMRTIGATSSLQYASQLLTQNEVPVDGRFAFVSPAAYAGVVSDVVPSYVYGNSDAVRKYNGLQLIDFNPVLQYPRFYNAALPAGGTRVSGSNFAGATTDRLVGVAGQKSGLVAAMRAPVDVNNGLVQSATATDPTSGISLQVRIVYDISKPAVRLATSIIYGVARGNPLGIVPIITLSV